MPMSGGVYLDLCCGHGLLQLENAEMDHHLGLRGSDVNFRWWIGHAFLLNSRRNACRQLSECVKCIDMMPWPSLSGSDPSRHLVFVRSSSCSVLAALIVSGFHRFHCLGRRSNLTSSACTPTRGLVRRRGWSD
ncbi:unnamed protein product [Ostreobium quekettii]|uniref:Uncharacterized protein n=1 Tax=Ostreobium quekettii TaxID=121088 RepID=A0A8S1JA79_9CHLO|nr:unnamed protein product [Ostreobium quekettii]